MAIVIREDKGRGVRYRGCCNTNLDASDAEFASKSFVLVPNTCLRASSKLMVLYVAVRDVAFDEMTTFIHDRLLCFFFSEELLRHSLENFSAFRDIPILRKETKRDETAWNISVCKVSKVESY
jgi:hypothetical protein